MPSTKMNRESWARSGHLVTASYFAGGERKRTILDFIVEATLARAATASARLLRLTKTACESVMNWPRRGVHWSSFFAMILQPLGKMRPKSARWRLVSSGLHPLSSLVPSYPPPSRSSKALFLRKRVSARCIRSQARLSTPAVLMPAARAPERERERERESVSLRRPTKTDASLRRHHTCSAREACGA